MTQQQTRETRQLDALGIPWYWAVRMNLHGLGWCIRLGKPHRPYDWMVDDLLGMSRLLGDVSVYLRAGSRPGIEGMNVTVGKITACSICGHFACVCKILADHKEGCPYRRSATCSVPIECDHGYDVCPECDPCTCEAVLDA